MLLLVTGEPGKVCVGTGVQAAAASWSGRGGGCPLTPQTVRIRGRGPCPLHCSGMEMMHRLRWSGKFLAWSEDASVSSLVPALLVLKEPDSESKDMLSYSGSVFS